MLIRQYRRLHGGEQKGPGAEIPDPFAAVPDELGRI